MSISNTDDLIASRDVIARIEELEGELTDMTKAELIALKSLADQASECAADWLYGEALIRRSYFVAYCQDLIADIGDIPQDLPSYIAIDWDATARNLEADYSSVDFGGVEYLIR